MKVQAIGDTDNIHVCPSFIGVLTHTRNELRANTPSSEITVTAPAKLIRLALQLCDGTKTLQEIIRSLPHSANQRQFENFLEFLFESGVLVDANLLTAHALRYGYQMSPFGFSASSTVTDKISRRFAGLEHTAQDLCIEDVDESPLDEFYQERISTYTFDDTAISAHQLTHLLWSLYGAVAAPHERLGSGAARRTISSAGALHLLQIYVVLQRSVGRYEPGVYRVHYPGVKKVALEYLNAQHEQIPRAFTQPWHVQFATGAIFLAADIELAATRYRNRATQYLFMEAGAALQNGGLSAPQLGLGFSVLGCYYESTVKNMCALDREFVLGSAVFGPQPTNVQLEQLQRAPILDFAWMDAPSSYYSTPLYLARANQRQGMTTTPHTWGHDAIPWHAYRKACAESVERLGFTEAKDLRSGHLADIENALSPNQFVRYESRQYALAGFPFEPFVPSATYLWKKATDCNSNKEVWVHADLVHPRHTLVRNYDAKHAPITYATTSGCAAGITEQDAFTRALFELVERDAFMRSWLAQTAGIAISLENLPAPIYNRIRALQDAQCDIGIQVLPSPWSTVVMVWAQYNRDAHHFSTMGTAAHDNPEQALNTALSELESRVFAWLNGQHSNGLLRPRDVKQTEHHFELYGLKKYFRKADNLFKHPTQMTDFTELKTFLLPRRGALHERFLNQGVSPLLVDLTPPECFIDQGRTKLCVVRAFVPSLVPLSFGYQLEPRAMVPAVHPESKFPHPFP